MCHVAWGLNSDFNLICYSCITSFSKNAILCQLGILGIDLTDTDVTPPNKTAFPTAAKASPKPRHFKLILSFLVCFLLPVVSSAYYLFSVANDQYASTVAFSVRKQEAGAAIELFGGITELAGSSTSDTDVLFEYLSSQQLVRAVNSQLSLVDIYHKPEDPFYSLKDDPKIEDLVAYWKRMITVYYDTGSGLIEIRVLAPHPDHAQRVAQAIFEESSKMINELSAIARSDATRYAKEELSVAIERRKRAVNAMADFRSRTGIVDPTVDLQGPTSVLNVLNTELARVLLETELLRADFANDQRLPKLEEKAQIIRKQIEKERANLLHSDSEASNYSRMLGEFGSLTVDLQFAEQAYVAALAAKDAAEAEANRQSRYLAAHIKPTLAETAEYPRRHILVTLVTVFSLLGWLILVMIYYSIRDRR